MAYRAILYKALYMKIKQKRTFVPKVTDSVRREKLKKLENQLVTIKKEIVALKQKLSIS